LPDLEATSQPPSIDAAIARGRHASDAWLLPASYLVRLGLAEVGYISELNRAVSARCDQIVALTIPAADFKIMSLKLFEWRWDCEFRFEVYFGQELLRLSVFLNKLILSSSQYLSRGK
jgi:hypothetical protein